MKCPVCWAEKAYVREVRGWTGFLLACVLMVPMRCHHCYHRFCVSWFRTLVGDVTAPPAPAPPTYHVIRLSHAASHYAAMRAAEGAEETASDAKRPSACG